MSVRELLSVCLAGCLITSPFTVPQTALAGSFEYPTVRTPIQHLVVIFQENISFDHYFGTYPNATNPPGEPPFRASWGTPWVNGLTYRLLTNNPNKDNVLNAPGNYNPFRLDRSQASTADQDHDYMPEQQAFDNYKMDLFPLYTGAAGPPPGAPPPAAITNGLVMGYYDGNTVTALWNYAQHFAMSDNSYGTTFGPSTPGAINLISGQTNGVNATLNGLGAVVPDGSGGLTDISDADPIGDVCSSPTGNQFSMGGRNIGDLLSAANVTWGFFEGGFNLSIVNSNGTTGCKRSTTSTVTDTTKADYIPHHQPFQYYASTANPTHIRPTSTAMIGHNGDAANHQYDINDFYAAVSAGNFPAVSFLKAPGYQDGHAGYSDPLDEQTFIVNVLNFLESRPEWASTAVVINYDDSDGWYDHVASPTVNGSSTEQDALTGPSSCRNGDTALPGINPKTTPHAQGRCGHGPRLPMMVISPWARVNYVDHTMTDQSSIIRFVEDNWLRSERIGQGSFDAIAGSIDNMFNFYGFPHAGKLILSPSTGEPQY